MNAIAIFSSHVGCISQPNVTVGGRDVHPIKWRAKYGGMDASLISQMKAMEDENRRLKRMYADLSMQADLLKEALGKK
jgi:hypothetical protein